MFAFFFFCFLMHTNANVLLYHAILYTYYTVKLCSTCSFSRFLILCWSVSTWRKWILDIKAIKGCCWKPADTKWPGLSINTHRSDAGCSVENLKLQLCVLSSTSSSYEALILAWACDILHVYSMTTLKNVQQAYHGATLCNQNCQNLHMLGPWPIEDMPPLLPGRFICHVADLFTMAGCTVGHRSSHAIPHHNTKENETLPTDQTRTWPGVPCGSVLVMWSSDTPGPGVDMDTTLEAELRG